jgi:hypothetical protein
LFRCGPAGDFIPRYYANFRLQFYFRPLPEMRMYIAILSLLQRDRRLCDSRSVLSSNGLILHRLLHARRLPLLLLFLQNGPRQTLHRFFAIFYLWCVSYGPNAAAAAVESV